MNPKNVSYNADYNVKSWWFGFPSGNTTQSRVAKTFIVAPGSSTNTGSHQVPKNWTYAIENRGYWYGQIGVKSHNGIIEERHSGVVESDYPTYPPWEKDAVYNRALEKLNAKARGELDLGIALAEAGSTMRMIRSVSKVIDFGRLSRIGGTRDLANGWLQWQYGWKPLVSDVFNAADEAIRVVLNKLERIKVRASIPYEAQQSTTRVILGRSVPVMVQVKGKVSCTIGVTYTVPTFDPARWSSLNPVSLAWELIPYSFVVDWFYDIGGWLRAMETSLLYGGAMQHGYISELRLYEAKEQVSPGHQVSDATYKWTYECVDGSIKRVDFRRTATNVWPLPRKPTFQVDLGAQRLTSAAALLRQLLKR
jgi:hypothetical protein